MLQAALSIKRVEHIAWAQRGGLCYHCSTSISTKSIFPLKLDVFCYKMPLFKIAEIAFGKSEPVLLCVQNFSLFSVFTVKYIQLGPMNCQPKNSHLE